MKIKKGDRGRAVADVQARLLKLGYKIGAAGVDEVFGEETERALKDFQKKRGLRTTGKINSSTWQKLVEESYELGDRLLYFHYPYFRGNDVRELQQKLKSFGFNPGHADAIFGPDTSKALKEFQQSAGLLPDGILGLSTVKALGSTRMLAAGGTALTFPRRKKQAGSSLSGRKIALKLLDESQKEAGGTCAAEIISRLTRILKGYRSKVLPVSGGRAPGGSDSWMEAEVVLFFRSGTKTTVHFKSGIKESVNLAEAINRNINLAMGSSAACSRITGKLMRENPNKASAAVTIYMNQKLRKEQSGYEEECQKLALSIAEGLNDYLAGLL